METEKPPQTLEQLKQTATRHESALDKVYEFLEDIGTDRGLERFDHRLVTGVAKLEKIGEVGFIKALLNAKTIPVLQRRMQEVQEQIQSHEYKQALAKIEKIRQLHKMGHVSDEDLAEAERTVKELSGEKQVTPTVATTIEPIIQEPLKTPVTSITGEPSTKEAEKALPNIIIDRDKRTVRINGKTIQFLAKSRIGWEILLFLAANPNEEVPSKAIKEVAIQAGSKDENPVSPAIEKLRNKFETDPKKPTVITTVGRPMQAMYMLNANIEFAQNPEVVEVVIEEQSTSSASDVSEEESGVIDKARDDMEKIEQFANEGHITDKQLEEARLRFARIESLSKAPESETRAEISPQEEYTRTIVETRVLETVVDSLTRYQRLFFDKLQESVLDLNNPENVRLLSGRIYVEDDASALLEHFKNALRKLNKLQRDPKLSNLRSEDDNRLWEKVKAAKKKLNTGKNKQFINRVKIELERCQTEHCQAKQIKKGERIYIGI